MSVRSMLAHRAHLLVALVALFAALASLSVASGNTTPNAVIAQAKAERCQSVRIGNQTRALNCRGPRGRRGLRGPRGIKGDRGTQGLAGTPGQTGARGPTGPKGAKGERGDDCVPSDSTCRGPQGDDCVPSNAACRGPDGDPGARAPTDGYYAVGAVNDEGSPGEFTVATKTVPAGNYAVYVTLGLFNRDFGDDANFDCHLNASGAFGNVDHTAADFNDRGNSPLPDDAPTDASVSMQAVLPNAPDDTVFKCTEGGPADMSSADAHITAIKVTGTH